MNGYKEIERSIIKKYRKLIWGRFVRGVEEYQLIKDGDKIAVCISGGKDSFLLAKCLEELKRHGKINFDLEFIVMNPGYKEKNIDKIKENANILNIPIKIFDSDIFAVVDKIALFQLSGISGKDRCAAGGSRAAGTAGDGRKSYHAKK